MICAKVCGTSGSGCDEELSGADVVDWVSAVESRGLWVRHELGILVVTLHNASRVGFRVGQWVSGLVVRSSNVIPAFP